MMIILGAITDKASLASCLSSWVYGAHCFDLVFDSLDFGNFMWNSTKIAKTLKKLISGRSVWLSTKMNFLVLVDLKKFSFFPDFQKHNQNTVLGFVIFELSLVLTVLPTQKLVLFKKSISTSSQEMPLDIRDLSPIYQEIAGVYYSSPRNDKGNYTTILHITHLAY